ncbi:MAG: hypothetical protein GX131_00550 [candidate division WS1 bacterium]|jgi:hypothetical protein|nr:hypothetical protein [candidate division WS1 bacterium]
MSHEPQTGADPRSGGDEVEQMGGRALTARSLMLALIFLFLGALWIRKASLIAFTILVGEGTPPVPALTALGLMTALGLALHHLTRTRRWRREALLVYVLLTCAFMTIDANGIRQLLSALTCTSYFAATGNEYAVLSESIPAWLAPHDETLIRYFYEGLEGGEVPWMQWLPVMAIWGGAFMLLTLSLGCLVSLFREPWAERERLTFPLAELALRLAPDPADRPDQPQLLRSWVFWVGVAFAAMYDGSNIAHAFSPGMTAIGQSYDLSPLLTERPWTGLRPLNLTYRPEIVGLGYLVPTDILFSVWAFFLLLRFENFFANMFASTAGSFPYDRAQGMGAYLALALFVLWSARGHLKRAARAAIGRGDGGSDEVIPNGVAVWGVALGIIGMTAFMSVAGIGVGRALSYTLVVYASSLVYAHIRAQTGLPITYGIPREEMYLTVLDLRPSPGGLSRAGMRAESVFALFTSIGRMTFGQLGAYQMEGIRIARRAQIRRSHLIAGIVIGLLGGLVLAWVIHLMAAYNYGWNIIDGGTTSAGYRTRQAQMAFDRAETRIFAGEGIKSGATVARGVGLVLSLLMLWLRHRFLRFPLNPVGLALAGTFGAPIWFPIFLAWLAKALILRIGGAQTYKDLAPAFLGLAIGHFLIAGGIWGIVGAINEVVANRYLLWFA